MTGTDDIGAWLRRQRGFTLGYDFRSFMRCGQVLLAESRTARVTCVSGSPQTAV